MNDSKSLFDFEKIYIMRMLFQEFKLKYMSVLIIKESTRETMCYIKN